MTGRQVLGSRDYELSNLAFMKTQTKRNRKKRKKKHRLDPVEDQEKPYRFSWGSRPDIYYVGHKDQKDWIGLDLSDFYIIILEWVVFNIQMSKKASFCLFPADVVDFLKEIQL